MKKPAAVMIDMFGVIIEEHRGNLPKYIAARSPLPDAQRFLDRAEYNKYYRPASEGAESSEDFLRRFGFGDANAAAREYVSDFVTFDRGFVAFAERCRAEGIATAGGSALKGEDSYACAMRELYEETGIAAGELTELGRVVHHENKTIYVEYLCITDVDKSDIVLQEGETSDYRWVDAAKLREMSKDELSTKRILVFIRELN